MSDELIRMLSQTGIAAFLLGAGAYWGYNVCMLIKAAMASYRGCRAKAAQVRYQKQLENYQKQLENWNAKEEAAGRHAWKYIACATTTMSIGRFTTRVVDNITISVDANDKNKNALLVEMPFTVLMRVCKRCGVQDSIERAGALKIVDGMAVADEFAAASVFMLTDTKCELDKVRLNKKIEI